MNALSESTCFLLLFIKVRCSPFTCIFLLMLCWSHGSFIVTPFKLYDRASLSNAAGICMAIKTWYFSKICLLHTPHAPAHEKGQDMATWGEHLSARLARQQSQFKHFWRSVEHYEETPTPDPVSRCRSSKVWQPPCPKELLQSSEQKLSSQNTKCHCFCF